LERNYLFYISVFLTIAIAVGSLIYLQKGLGIGVQIPDKILHAFGYFLLTTSWLLAFKQKLNGLKLIILIAFIIFIYGIVIEILQGVLTNYRQADIYDAFANLIGIAIASLFFTILLKKRK
jgi:VanZ family protein